MVKTNELVILRKSDIENMLSPIISKLTSLEKKLTNQPITITKKLKYYRTKDLKNNFGLSSNTIVKYRNNGTIPYTVIGDVYLYPVDELEKILNDNLISF